MGLLSGATQYSHGAGMGYSGLPSMQVQVHVALAVAPVGTKVLLPPSILLHAGAQPRGLIA